MAVFEEVGVAMKRVALACLILLVFSVATFHLGNVYGSVVRSFAHVHVPTIFRPLLELALGSPPGAEPSRFERQARDRKNTKIIVFVHGVTGTPTGTWAREADGKRVYWPDLIKSDADFADYDIFMLSYYTPSQRTGGGIFQVSQLALKELYQHHVLPSAANPSQYEKVVFVAHSMGNLVVRNIMLMNPLPPDSNTHIPLILSISAPSAGSDYARYGDALGLNEVYKEMVSIEGNSYLALSNEMWRNSILDTEIACAYEINPHPKANGIIVQRESATALCTRREFQAISEDHSTIAQPTGLDHSTYQWVAKEIKKPFLKTAWEVDRWNDNEIVVAGKDYPESNIHAAMITLVLRSELPHLKVRAQYGLGQASRVYSALLKRQIDIYPEYDITIMREYLSKPVLEKRSRGEGSIGIALDENIEAVNSELRSTPQTHHLRYLPHFGFHNSYVLVMLRSKAADLGILRSDGTTRISDLARVSAADPRIGAPGLMLVADQEFLFRSEWAELQTRYNLKFASTGHNQRTGSYRRLRESVFSRQGLVVVGFTNEVELNIDSEDLVQIEDDKHVFPTYRAGPLLNNRVTKKFPDISDALLKLREVMTAREMAELLVSYKQQQTLKKADLLAGEKNWELMEALVRQFLERKGILKGT